MKKYLILLTAGFLLVLQTSYSQSVVQSWSENFDDVDSIRLSVTPSNSWKIDTNYYSSSPNSYRAILPNMSGDYVILQTPAYDLTGKNFVFMHFKHICKISPNDIVRIEYRMSNQTWIPIPKEDYMGAAMGYDISRAFHSASYAIWLSNDSLAMPNQSWWREEIFDLSTTVGGDPNVEFRFFLQHGATSGTQVSYGWLIDDFKVTASPHELDVPVVQFVSSYPRDTVYTSGPYKITAKVKTSTPAPIKVPSLTYTASQGGMPIKTDTIIMKNSSGDSLWQATIPQFLEGTSVFYSITGMDSTENYATIVSEYYIKKPPKGEIDFLENSIALTSINSPLRGQTTGGNAYPIHLTFRNKGDSSLTSVIFNWAVNGVVKTPFSWSGTSLPWDFEDTVTIDSYVPRLEQFDTIMVWTSMPNGKPDAITYDDTLSVIIYGCIPNMAGAYTIGTTGNFSNIQTAIDILKLCTPLGGDVIFKLESDTYTETINLTGLNQALDNNTLTITSSTNNAEDVIIKTTTNGISLSNSDNIIIKNITVDATQGSSAITFLGICSNIVIRDCKLLKDTTMTTSTNGYVVSATSISGLNNISLIGNLIEGGYTGIHFDAGSLANTMRNVVIDSNIIRNQHYYAIYPRNYIDCRSISYNTIYTRTTPLVDPWYGIYIQNTHVDNIIGNRIIQRSNSTTNNNHAMYLSDQTIVSTSRVLVANNEINVQNATNAIFVSNIQADVINNSIYVRGTSAARGIGVANAASGNGLTIKNNNIIMESSTAHPIHLGGITYLYQWDLDYNNMYAPQYVGYAGVNRATITEWQQTVTTDVHSVSLRPSFIDSTSHLQLLNYTGLGCPKNALVDIDIESHIRAGVLTSIGCYHGLSPFTINATLMSISGNSEGMVLGISDSIKVELANSGSTTLTKATLKWTWNNQPQPNVVWTGSLSEEGKVIVPLGVITHGTAGYYTIKVWIDNLDQLTDNYFTDDTVFTTGYVCATPLSGIYSMGTALGADFTSFNDFKDRLSLCGANGNITLEVLSGTYNESINLRDISQILGNHNLTITSATGDASDVLFVTKGTGITLNNSNNITIRAISVDAISGMYSIHFSGPCTNIVIRDCRLFNSPTTNNMNNSGYVIYKPTGTGGNNISIVNNLIDGGYYGVFFYGGQSTSDFVKNIRIDSNTIQNNYQYALNITNTDFTSISYNTILGRTSSTYMMWYALYVNSGNGNIIGNRINQRSTAITNPYGIRLYALNIYNTSDIALVANNEIILSMTGTTYAINANTSKANILHNSIYVAGTGSPRGILITHHVDNFFSIKNNNIVMESPNAQPINLSATTDLSLYDMDYNNMYAPQYVGYADNNKATIEEWQETITTDKNSISVPSSFTDRATSLQLVSPYGMTCPPILEVPEDITTQLRGGNITTLGCYDGFSAADPNAMLIEILGNREGSIFGQSDSIKVVLINMGSTPITSATIAWSYNGGAESIIPWTGSLDRIELDTIVLGKIDYLTAGYYTLMARIVNLGNLTDQNPSDDTARSTGYICASPIVGGVYGIGTNGTYASVEDALRRFELCGVAGDIILELESGTYPYLDLSNTEHTFFNHTLTITSKAYNADSVIFNTETVGIKLANTKNLIIKNITVNAVRGTYGIHFAAPCTNIVIRDCKLLNSTTTTAMNNSGHVIFKASGTNGYNISIINNLIDGGYYGINFQGTSSSFYSMNNRIDSNIIQNSYYYGISINNADFTSVSYNTILGRTSASGSNWYGIYISNGNGNIIGNRINQRNTSSTQSYGIYAFYLNQNNTINTALVANNELKLSLSATYSGIYMSSSKANIFHNSIYVAGSGAANGIYIQDSDNNLLTIKKNNIVMASTTAYPIYLSAITNLNVCDMDYNNMYASQYVGYVNGDISSIAAWQGVVRTDSNSISIRPNFIDSTNNLKLLDYAGFECKKSNFVARDIDGLYRSGDTTTIGCYHGILPLIVNAALESITPLREGLILAQTDNIEVELVNTGSSTITGANIRWIWNGVDRGLVNWTGSLSANQKTIISLPAITYNKSGKNTITAIIENLGTMTDMYALDDTISTFSFVCSSNLSGTYTIPSSEFSSPQEFITAVSVCGVSGNITLQILPGTYQGLLDLSYIASIMGEYALTLTSSTDDAVDVNIQTQTTGIILYENKNIIIKDITIDAINGRCGIYFAGTCTNIVIRDCRFLNSPTTTATGVSGYAIQKANSEGGDNVSIVSNFIDGGHTGISFHGASTAYVTNVKIDSNIIQNTYSSGISSNNVDYKSFSCNTILGRTSAGTGINWTGINLNSVNVKIVGNRINQRNTTAYSGTGMSLGNLNQHNTMEEALIANNEIILSTTGTNSGISITSSKANVLHNSIYVAGTGTTRGIAIQEGNQNNLLAVKNNNIVMKSTGAYPIYLTGTMNISACDIDNNNMYAPTYVGYAGYVGGMVTSISAWQQTVTTDNNSVSIDPQFFNSSASLELSNFTGLICPINPLVTNDIKGLSRRVMTIMGAYTSFEATLDLEIANVICRQTTVSYPQTVPVEIGIGNMGRSSNIDSATFGWSVNGIVQPSYKWVASTPLIPENNLEIPIGSFNAVENTNIFDIVVWIENVNGGKDSIVWNDTARTSVEILFIGNNLNLISLDRLVPDGTLCSDDYTSIKVVVKNTGTLDYDFSANPANFSIRVTNPALFSLDTVISSGKILSGETAIIELTDMFPIITAGQYDIKVWLESSVDNIKQDDTLSYYYISGKFGLPLDEDFSDGVLPLVFRSEGNTSNLWQVISQGTGTDAAITPQFGTGMLAFSGTSGSISTLSTRQLDLSRTTQPSLSFWYFHDTIESEDYTDVRITIDGGATYTTLYSLTKQDAVYGWRQYSADLPAFAVNQCVILAFEAMEKSRSGNVTQYIDRIRITARQDIAITKILTSELSACDMQNKEWKVVLNNLADPALNYVNTPIDVVLEIVGTPHKFTKSLQTGSLPGFSSDTIILTPNFDFTVGTYDLKAYFTSVFDINPLNDTITTTIVFNPSISINVEKLSDCVTDFVIGKTDVEQTVIITNIGNMEISGINLILNIHSDSYNFHTSGSFSDILHPGGSKTYAFANKFTVPMDAEYHLDITAYLSCDSALVNADTSVSECVDDNDLYIVNIDHPTRTGIDNVGNIIKPIVSVGNHCMRDFDDVEITVLVVDLDGTEKGRIDETITRINMNDTLGYTFNGGYTVPAITDYKLIVYFKSVDNYKSNDTMTISRTTNHVGINNISGLSISMEQNIPNPANDNTLIKYSVPQDGEVNFKIYSVNGQILYDKAENIQSGDNQIEINTSNFAAGIYFYTMEFEGQRITKRMNKQ